MTRASFYNLMSRLEDERLVDGWYGGQVRWYRVTVGGAAAVQEALDFYTRLGAQLRGIA